MITTKFTFVYFDETMLAEEFRQSQSSQELYSTDYVLEDEDEDEED